MSTTETPGLHLHSVSDEAPLDPPTPLPTAGTASGLPNFEGQPVDLLRLKLSGAADLETEEGFSRIDDTVRMYIEGRVVRVDHIVDDKSGRLKRVQTIKVVDAIQLPWDFDAGQFE